MGPLQVADLPLFLPLAFEARFPVCLGMLEPVDKDALWSRAPGSAHRSEGTFDSVRKMLRAGGYKPSGRGKPASEYLLKAAADGGLPTINPVVDVLNVVSLVSGISISVVDGDLAQGPYSVRNGVAGEEYVFNASDQVIRLEGLMCLCDSEGPCANAVKDSQRTKTHGETTTTLQILWAPKAEEAIARSAFDWFQKEVSDLGARVHVLAD